MDIEGIEGIEGIENIEDEGLELDNDVDELLEQVGDLGAATAIELAVKTMREPDEVRPKLEKMRRAGLLKVRRRQGESDYEREIYLLSSEGQDVARERRGRSLNSLFGD